MKKKRLWLAISVFVTAVLILFRFNQIPQGLSEDEIEFARLALLLVNVPYQPYHMYATGHATMYFYILKSVMTYFGWNSFVLRIPAALFGIMSVGVFFLLIDKLFSKEKAIMFIKEKAILSVPIAGFAAILLASQRWYFSFARFGFEATFVILLELLSLYVIVLASEKKGKMLYFAALISGIFAGLAYNSYQPGRIFFLVPLVYMLYIPALRNVKTIAIFLLGFGVMIAPLSLYLSKNPDVRVYQQMYLSNPEFTLYDKISSFVENIYLNTKMLFVSGAGDLNGRHNYPGKAALNPIIGMLFLIGFVRSLFHIKDAKNGTFMVWLGLGAVPTLFTYTFENPNMLRTITMVPSIIFFVLIGILYLREKIQNTVLILSLFLLIGIGFAMDLRTYYVYQPGVYEQAFTVKDDLHGILRFREDTNLPPELRKLPK